MIQSYLQLQRRPFASIPSPEQYFPATSIENARASLVRLVDRQEGPGLIIAGVGMGKSLLCQLMAESFRHLCRVVVLPSGRLSTRRSLLQSILFELGLPYRDMEEGELRLSLIDHLTNKDRCPCGMLLLVDEAESLTMTLLDELRGLTNLTDDGRSCVRLVLFGGPRLEERFAHPRLESFNQRVAGRFYLEPFTKNETRQYIGQQFQESCGEFSATFTTDGLDAIHQATGGVPRLINQLTDHALVLAAVGNHNRVDHACIAEAWADLQQLPMPVDRLRPSTDSRIPAEIIEFGQLADEPSSEKAQDPPRRLDNEPNDESFDGPDWAANATVEGTAALSRKRAPDGALHAGDPTQPRRPEVTLYFHPAHDPFGSDYAEEEIVVDEFLTSDTLSRRQRRVTRTPQCLDPARQLDTIRSRHGRLSKLSSPDQSKEMTHPDAIHPILDTQSPQEFGVCVPSTHEPNDIPSMRADFPATQLAVGGDYSELSMMQATDTDANLLTTPSGAEPLVPRRAAEPTHAPLSDATISHDYSRLFTQIRQHQ